MARIFTKLGAELPWFRDRANQLTLPKQAYQHYHRGFSREKNVCYLYYLYRALAPKQAALIIGHCLHRVQTNPIQLVTLVVGDTLFTNCSIMIHRGIPLT